MSRENQVALACVVGSALLFILTLALDQHCVRTDDHDLACRAAARAVAFAAPAK